MNWFTWLFLGAIGLSCAVRLWLSVRQIRHVSFHRDTVPAAFAGNVSLAEHQKAADYTIAKSRLGRLDLLLATVVLLVWTLGGGLELIDALWRGMSWDPPVTGTAVVLSVFIINALLDVPLSAWATFVIEERFGFNRMTPRLFVADLLKGIVLLLLLGAPLTLAALWLMRNMGGGWWLYVWALWLTFSLLLAWAYPAFIAPLFNKFSALPEGSLRSRVEHLLERCGFRSRGIFVMDGSKRSAHGNAYFTGIGNNKRIVFFDTLLERLNDVEIEAVLAHELGHFRLRHILKLLASGASLSLAALATLGWLATQSWFYAGLGVATPSAHAALLLFLLAAPAFTVLFHAVAAAISRKHEFEADAYASQHSDAKALARALVTLYSENATTLTPDPLHSAFYDSHPPAPIRIARLEALSARQ
jgi:Zn-dependent protease with chaperone function